MKIDSSGLHQLKIQGLLGEGADFQVFAATDEQSNTSVVIKRPHPALISRDQHKHVERKAFEALRMRLDHAENLPHLAQLIAYTDSISHGDYFGDDLSQAYSVTVESRAKGVPLVGSTIDGIRRQPIGLPQNLFALHPLMPHPLRGRFSVQRDVLDLVEAFYSTGMLLLDLIPQNVFFDPASGATTVIDVGNLSVGREASARHAPIDIHDVYLELFKWYLSPDGPPTDADMLTKPFGLDSVPIFANGIKRLIDEYSRCEFEEVGRIALDILNRVQKRDLSNITEFRKLFESLLKALESVYVDHNSSGLLESAWQDSFGLFSLPHWNKFLFDSKTDLSGYVDAS